MTERSRSYEKVEELEKGDSEIMSGIGLSEKWDTAFYEEKKAVSGLLSTGYT